MKFGMRTPSLKKSISARTKGRATRAVKKALIPGYGKRAWDGLKILKGLRTIRFTTKHRLAYGIYSSKTSQTNES